MLVKTQANVIKCKTSSTGYRPCPFSQHYPRLGIFPDDGGGNPHQSAVLDLGNSLVELRHKFFCAPDPITSLHLSGTIDICIFPEESITVKVLPRAFARQLRC
jgi:hypothetical protein